MASTNFVDKQTVIPTDWGNDLDNFFYTIFGGATYASKVFSIDSNGDVSILDTLGGTVLFLDVSAYTLQVGKNLATASAVLELGSGRTNNGNSYIDFIGDTTYTDYGLRIIRLNTGADAGTNIDHRGTGVLALKARDAGSVAIQTSNTTALTVDSSQKVGIGISTPDTKLHIWNGSAGTVTAFANTLLTIENSTHAYINILTPNTSTQAVKFGDPEDTDAGQVAYNHSGDTLQLWAGSNQAVSLDKPVTATYTAMQIYDVNAAALQRLKVGANGTGPGGVGRAVYFDNI